MNATLTIQVPDTSSNRLLLADLLGVDGVKIERGVPVRGKYCSLKEGAVIAGVHYLTFRRWVIVEKKINYNRPSGTDQGSVRISTKDIYSFMEGRNKNKRKNRQKGVRVV